MAGFLLANTPDNQPEMKETLSDFQAIFGFPEIF